MPNLFWRNNLSFTRNCLNALKRVTVICSKVLYNAAAVYCQMGQWEQARDVLLSASQEKGPGRGGSMEAALESIRVSSFVFRFKVRDYLVRSWFSWKKDPVGKPNMSQSLPQVLWLPWYLLLSNQMDQQWEFYMTNDCRKCRWSHLLLV